MLIFEIPEAYSELQFSSWLWMLLVCNTTVYINLCWSLSTKDPNQPSRPMTLFCFSPKCCRYFTKLSCINLVKWVQNSRLFPSMETRLNSSFNIQKDGALTKINLIVRLPFLEKPWELGNRKSASSLVSFSPPHRVSSQKLCPQFMLLNIKVMNSYAS